MSGSIPAVTAREFWTGSFNSQGNRGTTPEQVGHLVSALDDLLGLQQNICGNEQDKRIDPRSVIAKRLEQKARHRKSRGQSAS